jgi:hypothetical protein
VCGRWITSAKDLVHDDIFTQILSKYGNSQKEVVPYQTPDQNFCLDVNQTKESQPSCKTIVTIDQESDSSQSNVEVAEAPTERALRPPIPEQILKRPPPEPLMKESDDDTEVPSKRMKKCDNDLRFIILDSFDQAYREQRESFASLLQDECSDNNDNSWRVIECRVDLSLGEPKESGPLFCMQINSIQIQPVGEKRLQTTGRKFLEYLKPKKELVLKNKHEIEE